MRRFTSMAQKVVVSLVDDLDGGQADETVEFSLDGKTYEIDLSSGNAAKLRDSVAKYLEVARRPGGGRRAARGTATAVRPAPIDREQNQAIREWARQQGKKVS